MNKNYYYILINAFVSITLYADISWKDANLSEAHSSFLMPDQIVERAEAARQAERLERERVERQQRERAQAFEAIMRNPNAADQLAALFIRFYQQRP